MKITRLKNGSYSARVYIGTKKGKKIIRRFSADTQKDLRRLINEAKHELSFMEKFDSSLTYEEAFIQYIKEHENIFSPTTIQGYRVSFRNSFVSLHEKKISDITEREIQAEVNRMASKLSYKSISMRVSLFISIASQHRREIRNWHIKMPPKKKTSITIPSKEDIEKLISYSEEHYPEMVLPIMFGAFCGLRRGEIASLTFSDIQNDSVVISKSTVNLGGRVFAEKTPKSYAGFRSVPLSERMLKVIAERKKNGLELISVSLERITDLFPKILKEAGVSHIRFHDLRHYFASTLVLLGIPDIYAIKLTGHSTTTMLRNVYQHTFPDAEERYKKALLSAL